MERFRSESLLFVLGEERFRRVQTLFIHPPLMYLTMQTNFHAPIQ